MRAQWTELSVEAASAAVVQESRSVNQILREQVKVQTSDSPAVRRSYRARLWLEPAHTMVSVQQNDTATCCECDMDVLVSIASAWLQCHKCPECTAHHAALFLCLIQLQTAQVYGHTATHTAHTVAATSGAYDGII